MQNTYSERMEVTATAVAKDSKAILDATIHRGELVRVIRHGRTVAEIRRAGGTTRQDLIRRLAAARFTAAEAAELRKAIAEGGEVLGHAGRD